MREAILASIGLALSAAGGWAQSIAAVTPSTIARSDRFVVTGSGFGAEPGQVLVGGVPAIVTMWSDTKVRAHVAEGTPLGGANVRVVAVSASNEAPVTITARQAGAGRLRWKLRTDHYYSMSRPAVARDGSIYITGVAGPMYAVSPDGGVRWVLAGAGGMRPATVAPDGTVYTNGGGASITALSPAGQVLWRYNAPSNAGPMFVGPSIGPDGKIYAVTEEEPSLGTSFGAFALNSNGTFAWSRSGGYNFRGSPLGWEIVFSDGLAYFATGQGGPITGNPGVHALEQSSGQERWTQVGIGKVQTDGAGNVYWLGALNNNYIGSATPQGDLRWTVSYNTFWGQPGGFVVAPNGTSFYGTSTFARFAGLNADGAVRWTLAPGHQIYPYGVLPDGSGCVAVAYRYSPTLPVFQQRSAADGSVMWEEPVPYEESVWMTPSWEGAFSPDGRTFYVMGTGNNYSADPYCYLYAFDVSTGNTGTCSADYNQDGGGDNGDVIDLAADIASGARSFPLSNPDFNQDGGADNSDVIDLANVVAGGPCPG